nr:hypothetical protein [Tanacetum cinerariifolium]
MTASAIIVSSNESVGSSPSQVILFGDIPTVIPSTSVIAPETSAIALVISYATPVVETTLVASPTGLCGLVPYSDSDSDSHDEMDSPEYITPLPATLLFLYTDSSEAYDSSDRPPSQDPYAIIIARWRSRVTVRSSSPSDFPIALVTAPPEIRRRATILIRPGEAIPLGRPYRTYHRPSFCSSPTDSSPVHSSGLDAPDQAHSGSSTRVVSPRLGDSSERPLHLSSHSAGPSRKRCRSSTDSVPLSTPVTGSLAPTCGDLLSPRKRFRDLYSSETSMEEDTEIDTTETEDGRELDIVDINDARDHVEIDPMDVRDDTEEYEAETSSRDTVKVGIDPMSAPIADEESEEPAGEDSSDSSGTRDGIVRTMTNTRSGMTPAAIEEMINRRVAEALEAYEINRNLGLENLNGNHNDGNDNEDGNGNGNGNGGNGNGYGGNGNGGNGTEGVVGLIRWCEKMETVFHISNYPKRYLVKYATYTLLDSALTWWNSHKRTIGTDAAYTLSWRELMKLMTKVFQELTMMCTKMVLEEEDRVEKFIEGLLNNIQGNVIVVEPTRLQDAIRITNNLMDTKLKGYANTRGQNAARAYTAGNNEKRDYGGTLPYCNRCKMYHEGQCTVKCHNCKRIGHLARDCRSVMAITTQGTPGLNQRVVTCFECGAQGHYRKDYPKFKNQNCGNKARVPDARGKAYVLGGGDANPSSNTVTGTFFLNDHHAYMLFNSGADRSFVSNTFSTLLDITPSALDVSYTVELADRRTSETRTVIRCCTLGLLGYPFNIDLMPIDLGCFDVIIGMD